MAYIHFLPKMVSFFCACLSKLYRWRLIIAICAEHGRFAAYTFSCECASTRGLYIWRFLITKYIVTIWVIQYNFRSIHAITLTLYSNLKSCAILIQYNFRSIHAITLTLYSNLKSCAISEKNALRSSKSKVISSVRFLTCSSK